MNTTSCYSKSAQKFFSMTFEEILRKELEDTLSKEAWIKEIHQHRSIPKLLNLFPLTPDLQPSKLHKSAKTSALVKAMKAKQIVARRSKELVTGGLLLHIDYKPQKRHPADWQLSFPKKRADSVVRDRRWTSLLYIASISVKQMSDVMSQPQIPTSWMD